MKRLVFLTIFSSICLADQQVDVVIPCVAKDLPILEFAIGGVKKNVKNLRRIIIVSPEKLTDSAEWFAESRFPFSIKDVGDELGSNGGIGDSGRRGWYLQQLIKLYSSFVIPDISENLLVVDADTVFIKPCEPISKGGKTVFYLQRRDNLFKNYINHMNNMHPTILKNNFDRNPIVNFMLFQRSKLQTLFKLVETLHKKPFWKCFCNLVDLPKKISSVSHKLHVGASEFALYFFFFINHYPDEFEFYYPKFDNRARNVKHLRVYEQLDYDLVTFHHYFRKDKPRIPWKKDK